ncbi:MAG TPA: hypothetical protein VNR36_05145 [Pseudolysinimonas sp.]|nr:hypothetical protein [Pseudolysinimonas sp.]
MRARVVASAALAALVAVVLAGCNFITPMASLERYDPSDGVSGTVGDIELLNAFVISDDGVNGNLVLTALNRGGKTVTLSVQYESGGDKTDLTVTVAGNGSTDIGGFNDGEQLYLEDIDTIPGGLLPLYFQYGDEPGRQLMVPVLDSSLPEYGDLVPVTPTPTPTATETPDPTPTEDAEG